MEIRSVNPANGEFLRSYEKISDEVLNQKLANTFQAHEGWKKTDYDTRKDLFRSIAQNLLENKEKNGRLITQEMGKPLDQSIAEIEKCALLCRYYAEHVEDFLQNIRYQSSHDEAWVVFEPLGLVYAIMPWNFPFWQVFRCAVPAMMAGNGLVLKHAENVPACALAIELSFKESGFPDNLFSTLLIDHEQSEKVIAHEAVQGISLTGSDRAGSIVAAQAGTNLKKLVLELGGSDPFIVLADADIEKAVDVGIKARFQNTGQSCIAAKRFILEKPIADEFIKAFVEGVQKLKVGDPMEEGVYIGPLVREDILETVVKQVDTTVNIGGRILTGGKKIEGKGYFYEPTVITDIPKDSPCYNEEVFGPAAMIFVVEDENEAIALANDTVFGLGASLWTSDRDKALRIVSELKAGSVFINNMVKSEASIPFGGIKKSGYGRELSDFGIREFVNIKTVCVDDLIEG